MKAAWLDQSETSSAESSAVEAQRVVLAVAAHSGATVVEHSSSTTVETSARMAAEGSTAVPTVMPLMDNDRTFERAPSTCGSDDLSGQIAEANFREETSRESSDPERNLVYVSASSSPRTRLALL